MPRFCEEKGRNWADVFQGCRERPDADDDGTRAYKRAEGRLLLPRLPRRHRWDSRRIPDEHQRAVPTGGNEDGGTRICDGLRSRHPYRTCWLHRAPWCQIEVARY